MIITTKYIRPNITIETELIGLRKFYIYNYKGIHYRVFNSLLSLSNFIVREYNTWVFECETEEELKKHLKEIM